MDLFAQLCIERASEDEDVARKMAFVCYEIAHALGNIAEKKPECLRPAARALPAWPVLVPATFSGKDKAEIQSLLVRVKAGDARFGALRKSRKTHDPRTPINRFLIDAVDGGFIVFKGKRHYAPHPAMMKGSSLVAMGNADDFQHYYQPGIAPKTPLPWLPASKADGKRLADELLMPWLKGVVRGDYRKLESLAAFKSCLNWSGMKEFREQELPDATKKRSAIQTKQVEKIKERAERAESREAWKTVRQKILTALATLTRTRKQDSHE